MRKLYEKCLSQTQFSVLNFEQIFQLSQKRLKRELKAELIANGYTVQKQKGFLYAAGTVQRHLCSQELFRRSIIS